MLDYLFLPCWFFVLSCGRGLRWQWMSGAIVAAIRCHFLHWFKALYLALQPGRFLLSALSSLPYLRLLMCQIQRHESKQAGKKCWEITAFNTVHEAKNAPLLPPQEKVFCSNLETNIQSVECIGLWHSLSVTPQAEAILMCKGMTTVFIPKWLEGKLLWLICPLGNAMHRREPLSENTTIIHAQHFCPSGLMFSYILWWRP